MTQLFNLQLVIDPEIVLLGGGVSENPVFFNAILSSLNQFYASLPVKLPPLTLKQCAYFNDSNLMGAYAHFKNSLGNDI